MNRQSNLSFSKIFDLFRPRIAPSSPPCLSWAFLKCSIYTCTFNVSVDRGRWPFKSTIYWRDICSTADWKKHFREELKEKSTAPTIKLVLLDEAFARSLLTSILIKPVISLTYWWIFFNIFLSFQTKCVLHYTNIQSLRTVEC